MVAPLEVIGDGASNQGLLGLQDEALPTLHGRRSRQKHAVVAAVVVDLGSDEETIAQREDPTTGGVLSLDESLKGYTFAEESLAELLRHMENQRDDLVVIFVGYPTEMEAFIGQNPGLASRIGIGMGVRALRRSRAVADRPVGGNGEQLSAA